MRFLRNIIAAVLSFFLILFGFVRRARNKAFADGFITSIYFHNPDKTLFSRCIKWLKKNNYVFISTNELIEFLTRKSLPPSGAVWVSFDDGWKENLKNILPVAEEFKVPVTIFVSTEPVENSGVFWWTYAEKYRNLLPLPYSKNIELLWKTGEDKRKELIENLKTLIQNEISREAMTVDELKTISKSNYITIGSHTVNHAILPYCTDEEIKYEISQSKKILESWTGKEVNVFSFPNGDYDARAVEYLKKNGFVLSVTAENRLISVKDDIYKLPRFNVTDDLFIEEICHMTGIWKPLISKFKIFNI